MKRILSRALLFGALSIYQAHAMELELGEGVKYYNMLNISVSLQDSEKPLVDMNNIIRLYTLDGSRLHACPSCDEDMTSVSVGSYVANVNLHLLEKNQRVVLNYSVFKQSLLSKLPCPLPFISYILPTTHIKSSGRMEITLNTEYKDVIEPAGTDLRLILEIKAVLTKCEDYTRQLAAANTRSREKAMQTLTYRHRHQTNDTNV